MKIYKHEKGDTCERCGVGTYQETHYSDDMFGSLHCTDCGFGVSSREKTEEYLLEEELKKHNT